MIVAFCGHAKYVGNFLDEKKVLEFLEKRVGDTPCEFYLGEYGGFDRFSYHCAKVFKETHSNARLIFVTPYLDGVQKHSAPQKERFDMIIYPEIENAPPRYAIDHRNRWIADCADIIVAYITHEYGGAYAMYRRAKQKHKEIYNIALREEDFA